MPKKQRRPKNEDNLKNKGNLKNEEELKNKDNLKNEDDLKSEEDLKNKEDLKNEGDLKKNIIFCLYSDSFGNDLTIAAVQPFFLNRSGFCQKLIVIHISVLPPPHPTPPHPTPPLGLVPPFLTFLL